MLTEDVISGVPGSVFAAYKFKGWCLGFRIWGFGFMILGVCCLQVGPLSNRGKLISPMSGPTHVIGLMTPHILIVF